MTAGLDAEPEPEADGSLVPPSTPTRTAVSAPGSDKPPCRHCGHDRLAHLGASGCSAEVRDVTRDLTRERIEWRVCACPAYEPKPR